MKYNTKFKLFTFIITTIVFLFITNTTSAGGLVNVDITQCETGGNGIDVEYEFAYVPGTYSNMTYTRNVLQQGGTIYSSNGSYAGAMVCDASSCTCDWGSPCPPSGSIETTSTEAGGAFITAAITFDWTFMDQDGGVQDEDSLGNASCTTPEPPSSECSDPISYTQQPTAADCGGDCDPGEYCVIGPPDYEAECLGSGVCTGGGGQCTGAISYTQQPTAANCGQGGCGSNAYCVVAPPDWVPYCQISNACGGGGCADLGEPCNVGTIPCCTPSHDCQYISGGGQQFCISGSNCTPPNHGECSSICPSGGRCEPINPTDPGQGGACVCTNALGGATSSSGYTDEPVNPVTYTGPIIDFESLITNLYRLSLPLAVGLGGVPLVVIGGYRILASRGDPKQVKLGKEEITGGVVGVIYLLLALSILRIVLRNFLGMT